MGLRTSFQMAMVYKKVNNFLKKLEEYGFINIKKHPVTIFYLVDFIQKKEETQRKQRFYRQ